MMRKKMVAGNWKMNKSIEEGVQLCSEIMYMVQDEVLSDVEMVIIPPFVHLTRLKTLLGSSQIRLGAQSCSEKPNGAYTGEVSATMLHSCGVNYVLAGHSERRQYFGETDEIIQLKIQAILGAGMKAIYCCGEPLEIREKGAHNEYVGGQVAKALFNFDSEQLKNIIIAYEPVWAIGTGKNATDQQAQEMHSHIRHVIGRQFGMEVAERITILYGGSVKPSNAASLFLCPDVDGGLIGGASLVARDFVEIIKAIQPVNA